MKPIETLSNLLKQEKNLKKKERIQALFWIKTWLYTVHDLDVAYKVVHDTVYYRLKAKLKVPRRSNIKKDANAEAEFKKRTARAEVSSA